LFRRASDLTCRKRGRHMTTHTVNTQTYVIKSGRESQKVARHQDRQTS